jgi:hypothetical protein
MGEGVWLLGGGRVLAPRARRGGAAPSTPAGVAGPPRTPPLLRGVQW